MPTAPVRLVSVVCPCYKESANIAPLVEAVSEALEPTGLEWEIVLVNDGSPDDTWARISTAAAVDPHVVGVNLSRNFGKEAAMLAGLREARGEAVILMDADLQHPPALLPEMLATMQEQQVDQVIARRTRDGDPWLRKQLSKLYYRIVRSLMDVKLEDGIGDFRLFSRRAVDAILTLTETNRFSKGLFAWVGFPRAVIDYRNVSRQAGASSWSFRALMNYGIDGVIAFNDRPLRLAVHAGFAAVSLALLYLLWLFIDWIINGVAAPGYLTTIGAIVLLGGVQLVFMGVLGEYIGRIHGEVKQRPVYIVADTIRRPEITS